MADTTQEIGDASAKIAEERKTAAVRSSIKIGEQGLSCEKCRVGCMVRTEFHRLSGSLVLVGYFLVLLVIFGAVLSAAGSLVIPSGAKATQSLAPVFERLGIAALLGNLAYAIPMLVVGLLLVLKRKVWKCTTCGYVFDRD